VIVEVRGRPLLGGLEPVHVPAESWEQLADCPICRRGDCVRDVATVADDAPAGLVAACTRCEHVFFRRRPTSAWFKRFYERDWDRGHRDAAPATKLDSSSRVLDFCRPHLPTGARVFEIGAGLGTSLRAFHEAGYTVSSVEPSEHRARFVSTVMGLDCRASPIEQVAGSHDYDLVYVNHVLEHLVDPVSTLGTAATLLRAGGHLYIAVPNLWNECSAQTVHYVPHLHAFTLGAVERLARTCGFTVVRALVQHDIQVLARKDTGQSDAVSVGAADFWDRLSSHVVRGFGGDASRHAIVWYPAGEHEYRQFIASTLRLTALRAGMWLRSWMPQAVSRRLLPKLLMRRLRALEVDVTGPPALPVHVRHGVSGDAVWVK
jgi:2-polyprenyl-3-methyl-5-hydroxy-6-metoxy-1,4-benzoquinol methylase